MERSRGNWTKSVGIPPARRFAGDAGAEQRGDLIVAPEPAILPPFVDVWEPYRNPPAVPYRGRACPMNPELEKAAEVLRRVPLLSTPLKTAQALADVSDKNGDDEPYNRVWRDRWNPVIVWFFRATEKDGEELDDVTYAWCAAFMNWVLNRCGLVGTGSSLARRFHEFDHISEKREGPPQRGDVVVYARKNSSGSLDPKKGHVGLYLGPARDERMVMVLGGNQDVEDVRERGIGPAAYPKHEDEKYLLLSYRAIESFKGLPPGEKPLGDPELKRCDD